MSTTPNGPAPRWKSLPQPTRIALTQGEWRPGARVLVTYAPEHLAREAERLTQELTALGHPATARPGAAIPVGEGAGDPDTPGASVIALRTGDPETAAPAAPAASAEATEPAASAEATADEAFAVTVHDRVEIVARSAAGVFRATRQILHNLRAQGGVPRGEVHSRPAVAERGFHLDAARKFYPADWLTDLVTELSYIGVNTFQWHFSENEGFRIASDRHPGIVSPDHLTKDEVRALLAHAADHHVRVVPSLDMPGHLRHALAGHPEWQLPAPGTDTRHALDITNPDAVRFAHDLVDEYAELFAGCRHWNLGADEFVAFERMADYPVLAEAARERFGPEANGFDLLTAFANDIAARLAGHGFTARVWNDGMFRGNVVHLDPAVQITWWTNWDARMRPVTAGLDAGHGLVNFMDSLMYYVLGEVNNYPYPTSERLWDEEWHPGLFTRLPGRVAQTWRPPYPEQLLGASFSVWCDVPGAQTPAEVAEGIGRPLRGMAERSWNAGSRLSHEEFLHLDAAIG
ncbi:family 20 glycosylhydrolase [Streptomyces sp. NPDC019224]|uniref:family 20 glycosylhydrolase n=1 Tax=Streptomyces sp. NPDC019224 TaxID=3154484 RepID=UPI0033CF23DE